MIILTAHPYRGDWTLQQVPLHGGRPLPWECLLGVGRFPAMPMSADQSSRFWLRSLISPAAHAGAFLSKARVPELASHRLSARVSSGETEVSQPEPYSIGCWQRVSWDPITSFPVGFFLKARLADSGKVSTTSRVPFVCNFPAFKV